MFCPSVEDIPKNNCRLNNIGDCPVVIENDSPSYTILMWLVSIFDGVNDELGHEEHPDQNKETESMAKMN